MHYNLFDMIGALGVTVIIGSGIAYLVGIPPIPTAQQGSALSWGQVAVFGMLLMVPMIIRRVYLYVEYLAAAKKEKAQRRRNR